MTDAPEKHDALLDESTDKADEQNISEQRNKSSVGLLIFVFIIIAMTLVGLFLRRYAPLAKDNYETALDVANNTSALNQHKELPSTDIGQTDHNKAQIRDFENKEARSNTNHVDDQHISPTTQNTKPAQDDNAPSVTNAPVSQAERKDQEKDAASKTISSPKKIRLKLRQGNMRAVTKELKQVQQKIQQQEAEIEALQRDIGTLREALEGTQRAASQQRNMLQSFSIFKRAVHNGSAYFVELKALQKQEELPAIAEDALEYFSAYAKKGISDEQMLKETLHKALRSYYNKYAVDVEDTQDTNLLDDVADWTRSLVTIRKVGADHQGNDDADIIARAEHFAQRGDITLALEEIRTLSVEASPYFKTWRRDANAYIESRRMMHIIESSLFDEAA